MARADINDTANSDVYENRARDIRRQPSDPEHARWLSLGTVHVSSLRMALEVVRSSGFPSSRECRVDPGDRLCMDGPPHVLFVGFALGR